MWLSYLLMSLLTLVGLFLIFIVLLQRGRGGGLAGAFGGMGGQSAFGTKAGDVFTKITVGVTIVWVLLAATSVFALRAKSTRYSGGSQSAPEKPGIGATGEDAESPPPAEETGATDSGDEAGGPALPPSPDAAEPAAPAPARPSTDAPAGQPQ